MHGCLEVFYHGINWYKRCHKLAYKVSHFWPHSSKPSFLCDTDLVADIEASVVVSIMFVIYEGDNQFIMGSKYGYLLTIMFSVFNIESDADNKKQGPACAEFLVKE